MTNYAWDIHNLQWFDAHYLTKASCEIAALSVKDFLSKGWKSAKNAWKIFQITIDREHPVQIPSRSDNCITTDIMQKSPKMLKKWLSLKNRGLVPTIQPEPDFSWTCGFR